MKEDQKNFLIFAVIAALASATQGWMLGRYISGFGEGWNYPLFAAPQAIAPALRATGWDLCTTASNHTMDQGWDGLVRTIEVHHDAGILTSGSWATEEDRNTLAKQVKGRIKDVIGVSTNVEVVPPQTLPRSEGKAKRVIDLRDE